MPRARLIALLVTISGIKKKWIDSQLATGFYSALINKIIIKNLVYIYTLYEKNSHALRNDFIMTMAETFTEMF